MLKFSFGRLRPEHPNAQALRRGRRGRPVLRRCPGSFGVLSRPDEKPLIEDRITMKAEIDGITVEADV